MEFKSVIGSHHLIEPIGYGIVRKVVKRGAPVRSAAEQFMIHSLAYTFVHPHIKTVKPICVESPRAYTMEQIYEGLLIPESDYQKHSELYVGLMEFQQFMAVRGYWPWGYKILWNGHTCFILDFSNFGTIDRDRIQFPKDKHRRTVGDVDDRFPLVIRPESPALTLELVSSMGTSLEPVNPTLNLILDMEKIEDWEVMEMVDGYYADLLSS